MDDCSGLFAVTGLSGIEADSHEKCSTAREHRMGDAFAVLVLSGRVVERYFHDTRCFRFILSIPSSCFPWAHCVCLLEKVTRLEIGRGD